MKFLITFILTLLFISCGSNKTTPLNSVQPNVETKGVLELTHKRVKELFVVIFEKNYTIEEWKIIFDLTKVLSENKKTLRQIEGEDSESAQSTRSIVIKKNAEILTQLSAKSVFMLSWSAQDENCKIQQKDYWVLTCRPHNYNNSLNGGLPVVNQPLEWMIPDPVRSEIKMPYLRIVLDKLSTKENVSHYSLELRLKMESQSDLESWFKGDVVPSVNSQFLKQDGFVSDHFFPYGYSEMTMGN